MTSKYIRRVAHSALKGVDRSHSEAGNFGTVALGLHLPRYRWYSHSRFSSGNHSHASFPLYSTTKCFGRSGRSQNFSALSACNAVSHHAQIAWKRLSQKCYSNPNSFSPISRIAQAVSLAVTRSHPVVPGIFAVACGQAAWAQSSFKDNEHYPSQSSLYMRAQDGHAYMTSLLWSVLGGLILLMRALYLAILFSPSIMMAPFADSCGVEFRKLWLHIVHRTLERAGPAFIKWGQWAATRPDLFPRDLCNKLSELHTKAPEHSFAYTKKTIERAFGRKLSEIFDNFEETPVASGSIAQVHRASLRCRYPGQQGKPMVVAVKVRHPGVGESIRRDFMIINSVAKISTVIPTLKWLRLDESVQQFAVFMMSQVDLAREAAHLSRFIYNFRRWRDVSFPKPVYPLVHPAVLVETFEHGESVSHFVDELEGHNRIKSALAHIGTHALLKMLLVSCDFVKKLYSSFYSLFSLKSWFHSLTQKDHPFF